MIRYSPITGARLISPLSDRHPSRVPVITAWRSERGGDWKYDPFTGGYRPARDVQSDPLGYKLVPPVVTIGPSAEDKLEQARAHLKSIYEMSDGKVKEEARIALGLPEPREVITRWVEFKITDVVGCALQLDVELVGNTVVGVKLSGDPNKF